MEYPLIIRDVSGEVISETTVACELREDGAWYQTAPCHFQIPRTCVLHSCELRYDANVVVDIPLRFSRGQTLHRGDTATMNFDTGGRVFSLDPPPQRRAKGRASPPSPPEDRPSPPSPPSPPRRGISLVGI